MITFKHCSCCKTWKNTAGSSERSRLQSCGPHSDAWSTVTQRSLTRAYPPATVSAATSYNLSLSSRETHGLRPTVPSALAKESWRIRTSGKLRRKPALVHSVYISTSNTVVTGASNAKMESWKRLRLVHHSLKIHRRAHRTTLGLGCQAQQLLGARPLDSALNTAPSRQAWSNFGARRCLAKRP